jgi:NadR type nicotinamide-nucleotide adenylyltransferase
MSDLTRIKRVAIVGPECTGKTQLSIQLAKHYKTVWVPEYARQYIDRLNRPYTQADLLKIAKGQTFTEDELALEARELLICDTNLVVVKIWSEFKYGVCDAEILRMLHGRKYDLHLLTSIDVPWENDPQREHPHQRELLFALYIKELENLGVQYVKITGGEHQRLEKAVQAIDNILP